MRRVMLLIVGLALVPVSAQDGPEVTRLKRANRKQPVDDAIRRGLAFLTRVQNPDGSFGRRDRNALTSLAILAFLASGHTPDAPTHGKQVAAAIDYLLAKGRQKENGYFGDSNRHGMYNHAITVLALAEVIGMGATEDQERKLRAACQRGVELLVAAQSAKKKGPEHVGGWRYSVTSNESDLSVTAWVVMALRAAQNAGIAVPKETIGRAVAYVKKLFDHRSGGFSYLPRPQPTFAMSAAGLLALQVCGVYEGREVRACGDWLMKHADEWRTTAWQTNIWFYYGTYYYAQASYQLGGEYGKLGEAVVKQLLLADGAPAKQQPGGNWPFSPRSGEERRAGNVYTTSMAILALSVEYKLLPIYQR